VTVREDATTKVLYQLVPQLSCAVMAQSGQNTA